MSMHVDLRLDLKKDQEEFCVQLRTTLKRLMNTSEHRQNLDDAECDGDDEAIEHPRWTF